jgi:hypothetical protein
MDSVSQLGGNTLNALSYLGSLGLLGARVAYYSFVARLKGKPLRFERAISQAMDTGVRTEKTSRQLSPPWTAMSKAV